MKKIYLLFAFLGVLTLTFGAVGFAYAQNQTPPTPEYPYGPGYSRGMMGGFGGHGRGMMSGDTYGPMHNYMVDAFAEKLGISTDEISARLSAGENMFDIAYNAGLEITEAQEIMLSAHSTYMDDAVANGWLTPEQANWMNGRMTQMWGGGYTFPNGNSNNGSGYGRGHCGNWGSPGTGQNWTP
jgi:Spy/CpxP family protein refolding chaperone